MSIAAKRDALIADGWTAVEVLDVGERFNTWQFAKTAKKKGGRVYIAISQRGEVEIHEGWLSEKDARKAQKKNAAADDGAENDEATAPNARPAMTKSMENYIALHRHAAVRLALIANPGTALRLLVAHALAASGNWKVEPDGQKTRSEDIRRSVDGSPAQTAFAQEKAVVEDLLNFEQREGAVTYYGGNDYQTVAIFAQLLTLSDEDVQRIAAYVMAETLALGGAAVEAVGLQLKVDAGEHWQPDDAFFELLREKATANAMLAEVAGQEVADANVAERAKVQKQIIRDSLGGTHGRVKVESWLPGWMAFPFRGYGDGTCGIAQAAHTVSGLLPRA